MGMNNDCAPWYRFSSTFYRGFEVKMLRASDPKNWMKIVWLYKRFCAEVAAVNFSTGIIPSLGKTTKDLKLDVLERYFGMKADIIQRAIELLFDVNLIEIQGENYVVKGWTKYQHIKAFKTAQRIHEIREEKKWEYKLNREMNSEYGKSANKNSDSQNEASNDSNKENVFAKKVGGRPESLESFISEMNSIGICREKAIAVYQQHEATMINGEWVDGQKTKITNRIKYFEKAAEQWYEPQNQVQQNQVNYQPSQNNQQQSVNQYPNQQGNQNQSNYGQNNATNSNPNIVTAGGFTFDFSGKYVYPKGKTPFCQSREMYAKIKKFPNFKPGIYL